MLSDKTNVIFLYSLEMEVVFGRCRKGWLKNTSKGIRSRAFRRSRPIRRLHNSGLVPGGILKCYITMGIKCFDRIKDTISISFALDFFNCYC